MTNITESSDELNLEMWSKFMETSIIDLRMQAMFPVVMSCVIIMSLTGNLLTCVVIYYDKTMHTVTNCYLFILAVSDLVLTFTIFISVHEHISGNMYREFACKVQWLVSISLWNYSILTMVALSIERYIAVCYPLCLKSTPVPRRVLKIVAIMWLVALVETAPELLTVNVIKASQASLCFTIPTHFARVLNGVLALLTFVIPLIIMVAAYSMIILKVNSKRQKNIRNSTFNYTNPRGKVNILILVMTLSFLICWLPFFIIRVMIATLDAKELNNHTTTIWGVMFNVCAVGTWFCVVLNPIVFSLGSTKFRKSLKALWSAKIRKKKLSSDYLRQRSERASHY